MLELLKHSNNVVELESFPFSNKRFSLTSVIKHFAESLLRAFLVALAHCAKHLSRQIMWTAQLPSLK